MPYTDGEGYTAEELDALADKCEAHAALNPHEDPLREARRRSWWLGMAQEYRRDAERARKRRTLLLDL